MNAPLQAYLEIAYNYYLEDRVDLAMQVIRDASETQGWPINAWIAFYNELQCEADAREASEQHSIDSGLMIEIVRGTPPTVVSQLASAARAARESAREMFGARMTRLTIVTVFLPDAPTEFISGSHGYTAPKDDLDKICIPYSQISEPGYIDETLEHEFAHVAIHELGGKEVPRWLDEGLATYACGELNTRQARYMIETAAKSGRLMDVNRLAGLLGSADARKDDPVGVAAAYYLAGSLMRFWIETHGMESVREALAMMRDGSTVDRAVSRAVGRSTGDLVNEWRSSVAAI